MSESAKSLLIRPIAENDLDTLCNVAKNVGPGFTSLPDDREYLKKKLQRSLSSFAEENNPKERLYLFFMEDLVNNKFAGICGIEANVGYNQSFYNYKVSVITQICEYLHKYLQHKVLQLVNDFQDSSELVSLFLHPDYRGNRRGELLSRSRLLFIAEFNHLFSDSIISEIRGISDKNGNSPFWESVGRPFFDMDFIEADTLTTLGGKQFIADLIPTYPLYVDLMSKEAQAVIGVPNSEAKRAKLLLEQEGFMYRNYIDIFDGGPLIEGYKNSIRTIANSRKLPVKILENFKSDTKMAMICNDNLDFRLCLTEINLNHNEQLEINKETADLINVEDGQLVRFCLF